MFNKELYKKELFEKYENLSEEQIESLFSNPKKNNFKKISSIITIMILGVGVSVFAHNELKKDSQNPPQFDQAKGEIVWKYDEKFGEISEEIDGNNTNCHEYKIISDYDTYIQYLYKVDNLVYMSEEDFNDNFLVIVQTGLYFSEISNVYNKDSKMYIDMSLEKYVENEYGPAYISVKVPNEVYSDEVIINLIPELPEITGYKSDYTIDKETQIDSTVQFTGYKSLLELPDDYTTGKAIKDNCATRLNPELLDEFIEKTENNENCSIRTVRITMYNLLCCDILYKDGIYYVCEYTRYFSDEHQSHTSFYSGNKIYKYKSSDGTYNYFLSYVKDGRIRLNQWIIL